MKSQKCPYHVTFDLDLEHMVDAGPSGAIACKFGGDPAISVVEEAICAKKFTDGRTDGRRTPRDCISSWNELLVGAYARSPAYSWAPADADLL